FEIGIEESHPQPEAKRGSPLYIEFQGRRWHSRTIVFGAQWHHVAVNFEDGSPSLMLDGKPVAVDPVGSVVAIPSGPLAIGDPHKEKPLKGDIGSLRIYGRTLTPAEVEVLALRDPIRFILDQDESTRSKEQKQRLLDYFLTYDGPADLRRAYSELKSLRQRLTRLKEDVVSVQVM